MKEPNELPNRVDVRNDQVQAAARDDENLCPHCMRHVMRDPAPATGWIAYCGRRLTRIEECGRDGCCSNDEHGECVYPSASRVTPADPALDAATVEACVNVLEERRGRLINVHAKATLDGGIYAIRALASGEERK